MSPSPSEPRAVPARSGGSRRAGWLARLRGVRPRHVVYLRGQGVRAWAPAAASSSEHASFDDWCAAHPDVEASVHLGAELTHSLVVDAALRLQGADAVHRHVRQQFTHFHGAEAAAWPLAIWTTGGHAGACAAPGLPLDAMRAAARAHRVRLVALAPAWSAGLVSLARHRPAFASAGRHALLLVEGMRATWLVAQDGRLVGLTQRYLDAPTPAAAASLLAELLPDAGALASPPSVLGWDLDGATATPTSPLPVASAWGPDVQADWLHDRMGART